jgi:transcriptional regulator with XRE-family HTH domain
MSRSQHSARYKRFCVLLVEARQAKGLTQAEVARRLGKPQSFVAKYEGGERRLDVVEFLEIVDVLGVRAVRLLRGL